MQRLHRFYQQYHPVVHVLLLGTILARTAASMSMPFLAIHLSKNPDLSPISIGFIIGIGSLAGMLGGFLGGALSDRFGRKLLMIAALFGWAFVFCGFAVVHSPPAFMLLNMLNGLCKSLYEPVSQALMADLTDRDKRLRVFSLRYLAINVGVAVGPLLGAYIGTMEAWLPFLLTGLVYLLYGIGLMILLQAFGIRGKAGESKQLITLSSSWQVIRGDRVFRLYIAGAVMGAIGYSQMTVTLSQHIEQHVANGASLFAFLMSLNAVIVIAFQVPLSKLSERWRPVRVIAAGNLLFAAGDIGFACSDGWAGFITAMFFFTLGEILNYPMANVLIDQLAPGRLRGTYFGAQMFANAGHFAGPWAGGFILTEWGGASLFLTMALVTLAGTWFYWRGQRLFRKIGPHTVERVQK